jgi:hypothetical protein
MRTRAVSRDGHPTVRSAQSDSELFKSISESLGPKPSAGMLVAEAAAAELTEMDDAYAHLVQHHALLAKHKLQWGEKEQAVECLRKGLAAVQAASKGWRGTIATARSRLTYAAALSEAGDHNQALQQCVEAMDSVEELYNNVGPQAHIPGRLDAYQASAKVLCVARHMLATELEFLSAPAAVLEELREDARGLEAELPHCSERSLCSTSSERFLERHSASGASTQEHFCQASVASHTPESSLLYRACVRARAALQEDAIAKARQVARSEPGVPAIELNERTEPKKPGKQLKRHMKSHQTHALDTPPETAPRKSDKGSVFVAFLSTSGEAEQRREALVHDAPSFQKRFREYSTELHRDLEYKTGSDMLRMKLYHSSSTWPTTKKRLRRLMRSSSPSSLASDVAGLSRELRKSEAETTARNR